MKLLQIRKNAIFNLEVVKNNYAKNLLEFILYEPEFKVKCLLFITL